MLLWDMSGFALNRKGHDMSNAGLEINAARLFFAEVAAGHCVPFVGAGFSTNAAVNPPPGYDDFARILARDVLPNLSADTSPEQVFELLSNAPGEDWLRTQICQILRRAKPGRVHELFVQVPWPCIITTNWDLLLEAACDKIDRACNACASEADSWTIQGLGPFSPELQILKIHGDCGRKNDMLVRPSSLEYDRFLAARPRITEYLNSFLQLWTPVFIGYSHRDQHMVFIQKLLEVRRAQVPGGGRRRRLFQITLDPTPDDFMRLESQQIMCIPLATGGDSPQNAWQAFLEKLLENCKSKKPLQLTVDDVRRIEVHAVFPADGHGGSIK